MNAFRHSNKKASRGSGGGNAVGRAVAAHTSDLRFESSPRQNLHHQLYLKKPFCKNSNFLWSILYSLYDRNLRL